MRRIGDFTPLGNNRVKQFVRRNHNAAIKLTNDLRSVVPFGRELCNGVLVTTMENALLIDGGFTRLYNQWDDAGSARFVYNAAAWLVNWERFSQGNDQGPSVSDEQNTLRDLLTRR